MRMSFKRENAGFHFHVHCTSVFFFKLHAFINLRFNYVTVPGWNQMACETDLQQLFCVPFTLHKLSQGQGCGIVEVRDSSLAEGLNIL